MKKFLDYFKTQKKSSASVAKERLKIIVAHQRSDQGNPDFISNLRQELIVVIAKYVHVDLDQVKVELEEDGNNTVLELNVTLPKEIQAVNQENFAEEDL